MKWLKSTNTTEYCEAKSDRIAIPVSKLNSIKFEYYDIGDVFMPAPTYWLLGGWYQAKINLFAMELNVFLIVQQYAMTMFQSQQIYLPITLF